MEIREMVKLPDDLVNAVEGKIFKSHIGVIKITNNFLPSGFSGVVMAKSSKNFYGFQGYVTILFEQSEIETMSDEELLNMVLTYFYHRIGNSENNSK